MRRYIVELGRMVMTVICASVGSANAQVIITQAKALAGNITPGDAPGFPVTISTPGAYVVGSRLVVPINVSGIVVTSAYVDIDLRGFAIQASLGGSRGHGIETSFLTHVRNGFISSFPYNGVWVRGDSNIIEDMNIDRNLNGIDANSTSSTTVRRSIVSDNFASGIAVGALSHVESNTINENKTFGLLCLVSCNAQGNTIMFNLKAGARVNSGFLSQNYIASNREEGILDLASPDVGLSNNYLSGNNVNGTEQIVGGVVVHPNSCTGKPC